MGLQRSNCAIKGPELCTPPEITWELEKDTEAEAAALAVLRRAVLEAGCAELRHKFVAQAITEGSIGGDILPLI